MIKITLHNTETDTREILSLQVVTGREDYILNCLLKNMQDFALEKSDILTFASHTEEPQP